MTISFCFVYLFCHTRFPLFCMLFCASFPYLTTWSLVLRPLWTISLFSWDFTNTLYTFLIFYLVHTISVSFGPAHPAAHGVFRLVLELDEEIVTTSVSHLILEFGFCFGSMDYSPQLNLLGHQTLVANHLLNLGCTLADAGMVSAILWSFEVRDSGGTDRGSFWIPFTLQLCSLDFCFAWSARLWRQSCLNWIVANFGQCGHRN